MLAIANGVLALVLSLIAVDAGSDTPIAYPQGYREWVHIKSGVILPGSPGYERFGGIHHIYANSAARQGMTKGEYPDGAILVFDRLAERSVEHGFVEGERRTLDIMVRDAQRFPQTGGWGFEEFAGDSHDERRVGSKAVKQCFECHSKREQESFVYSKWRE